MPVFIINADKISDKNVVNFTAIDSHDEDHHYHEHQKNYILSLIIWTLEAPHIAITVVQADVKETAAALALGVAAASGINGAFWAGGANIKDGFKEFLDLLGHAAIAYITYSGIKELAIAYLDIAYPEHHREIPVQDVRTRITSIVMVGGTVMHFSKAAVLSAPTMIERESVGAFFIPAIAVAGPALLKLIGNKLPSSGSVRQRLMVGAGVGLLVIGTTAGVSSMITTLGEHISFDYVLYDLTGEDDEDSVKAQLLHTIGLEKITVGTITSSTLYTTAVIVTLYGIYKHYKNRFTQTGNE